MKTFAKSVAETNPGNNPATINNANTNTQAANNSNTNLANQANNIDASFFDDKQQQQQQFTAPAGNAAKRPASLDLNTTKANPAKKQRMSEVVPTPMLLESLATPDLEKILMPINLLQDLTPVLAFSQKVTSEQEGFAKGFVEALKSLQNNDNNNAQQQAHTNGMSGGSFTYTNLDDSYPVAIKDEPQNPPPSPPQVTPIDLENQEKIKLERKRQRNRVAASKCRKRKLERISKLEDKVKQLKSENHDLAAVLKQLKEHVFKLKQEVVDHINAGCNISLYNGATMLQGK